MTKWKKYGKTWRELRSDGLAKAGTIIEVKGKSYLIGNINECGGICDDCVAFDFDSKISRYRIVTR